MSRSWLKLGVTELCEVRVLLSCILSLVDVFFICAHFQNDCVLSSMSVYLIDCAEGQLVLQYFSQDTCMWNK